MEKWRRDEIDKKREQGRRKKKKREKKRVEGTI